MIARIGLPIEMSFQEAIDDVTIEEFPICRETLLQGIDEHSSQWAAQPFMSGNVKAGFFALQDGSRKLVFPQFTQHQLLLSAVDFQSGRELRSEFHDAVIEKWRPNFDRVRHAHAIALYQNIVGQVIVLVEPEQRSKMVFRSR